MHVWKCPNETFYSVELTYIYKAYRMSTTYKHEGNWCGFI